MMYKFMNSLLFGVARDFCSLPSLCCVLREQLKGMCETVKESCPTGSERKHSMAVRHTDLGTDCLGSSQLASPPTSFCHPHPPTPPPEGDLTSLHLKFPPLQNLDNVTISKVFIR